MGSACFSKKYTDNYHLNVLIDLVESNSTMQLRSVLAKMARGEFGSISLNTVIKVHSMRLSLAGYALYVGSDKSFEVLFEALNFDMQSLIKQFEPLNKSPLDVICELGYEELLHSLLPHYLAYKPPVESEGEDFSIFGKPSAGKIVTFNCIPMTPIQRACEKGQIRIVRFLVQFFAKRKAPPDFDVHHVEETTGVNCALAACRTGKLELIKFLHEDCGANFRVLNKRGETAVQIAAAWSKKRKKAKFLPCIKYLVEVVGVSLTHDYEELLLVLEDEAIIRYVETCLQEEGVHVQKHEVDHKYTLTRQRTPTTVDRGLAKKLERLKGPEFEFKQLFAGDLSESACSSISPAESKNSSHVLDFSEIFDSRCHDNNNNHTQL